MVAFTLEGKVLVHGTGDSDASSPGDLLYSSVALSFWGGVDPETAVVLDHTHPLHRKSVAGSLLAIPSGRGSCTGSQVLLELILNGCAPKAIFTRDVDPILCVGAIIADEVFGEEMVAKGLFVPPVVCLGNDGFDRLAGQNHALIALQPLKDGAMQIVVGTDSEECISLAVDINDDIETSSPRDSLGSFSRHDLLRTLELTEEERRILDGQAGTDADRVALRTICRVATVTESPRLIPVTQAHIDGCTYIGPGGLLFVEKLVELGGRVKVPTTLNSVSADRRRWRSLGVDEKLATPANKVGDAYLRLGCTGTFTCAPYLLPSKPGLGENICWGESNAVVYSNSILGARTDKYADYMDICAALVGRVPEYGVHLTENRMPEIVIDVNDFTDQFILPMIDVYDGNLHRSHLDAFFPVLGHVCGSLSDGMIPIIVGMEKLSGFITKDDLKAFSAAFGTTGSVPLFHIMAITPEASDSATAGAMVEICKKNVSVTHEMIMESVRLLDSGASDDKDEDGSIDLIALGNPHLSLDECERLANMMDDVHPDVRVLATLSRHVYDAAKSRGHIKKLEQFGVQFVSDTCWCMLLDPPVIPPDPSGTIGTNSGKYAHYGPGLTNRRMRFGSMAQCIEAARRGRWDSRTATLPKWLRMPHQRRAYSNAAKAADVPTIAASLAGGALVPILSRGKFYAPIRRISSRRSSQMGHMINTRIN